MAHKYIIINLAKDHKKFMVSNNNDPFFKVDNKIELVVFECNRDMIEAAEEQDSK